MLVHIFGAAGLRCCATFAVKCVARDNKEIYSRAASESILQSFYADDLLKLVITAKEAVNVAEEITDVMRRARFRLTKFISNNKNVMNSIPAAEISNHFKQHRSITT